MLYVMCGGALSVYRPSSETHPPTSSAQWPTPGWPCSSLPPPCRCPMPKLWAVRTCPDNIRHPNPNPPPTLRKRTIIPKATQRALKSTLSSQRLCKNPPHQSKVQKTPTAPPLKVLAPHTRSHPTPKPTAPTHRPNFASLNPYHLSTTKTPKNPNTTNSPHPRTDTNNRPNPNDYPNQPLHLQRPNYPQPQ